LSGATAGAATKGADKVAGAMINTDARIADERNFQKQVAGEIAARKSNIDNQIAQTGKLANAGQASNPFYQAQLGALKHFQAQRAPLASQLALRNTQNQNAMQAMAMARAAGASPVNAALAARGAQAAQAQANQQAFAQALPSASSEMMNTQRAILGGAGQARAQDLAYQDMLRRQQLGYEQLGLNRAGSEYLLKEMTEQSQANERGAKRAANTASGQAGLQGAAQVIGAALPFLLAYGGIVPGSPHEAVKHSRKKKGSK
jgi:hypothetical protein